MDTLVEQCQEGPFSRSVLIFLGEYTQDGAHIIADKQHFDFELSRLSFNSWGALKKVTQDQRRMLLTFWVVIHVMLPLVFSRPWEIDASKFPNNLTRVLNLRFCGSLLYHLFLDNFRTIPRIPNNQANLPTGMANVARKENYKFGKVV